MSPLYIIKLFISLNLFISRTTCSCHTSFRTHLFFSSYRFVFFLFRVFFFSPLFVSFGFFISAFDLNLFIYFLSVSFLHSYLVPFHLNSHRIFFILAHIFLTIFSSIFSTQKDQTDRMQCQMSLYKKLTCKGTMRQVFYLSKTPLLSYDPILPPCTLNTCKTDYLFTQGRGEGGELTIEKVRGEIVHKTGRKYQHDQLYFQSMNYINHKYRRHLGFDVFTLNQSMVLHIFSQFLF